ncbi:MAG: hypothetical protein WC437_04880 [Patescibacteria group bacterium]
MKVISIEENVYRITNADFEKLNSLTELHDKYHIIRPFTEEEVHEWYSRDEFMEYIEKKYTPILVLDERYNY